MPLHFDNTDIAFKHRSTKELKKARFLFSSMASPFLTKVGMKLTNFAFTFRLPVKDLIKKTLFKQFVGGETIQEAATTARLLSTGNISTILDYGVEGKQAEEEYDHAAKEFVKAIEYASEQDNIPFISIKVTGFARFELLEKLHSGTPLSHDEEKEWFKVRARVNDVCASASRHRIMILIDAEESWIQKPIDEIADEMMRIYNLATPVVYNTFQMYRHDRLVFLHVSSEKALDQNYILGAKLVRGAYMEKERARAAAQGYPSPIQPTKLATDADYDDGVRYCLDNIRHIALFVGTHNEQSCLLTTRIMSEKGIDKADAHVWFSQLFGMSDNISYNLSYYGYNVAKYLPYGPVKDVVPYLMRRAQENTSVKGQTGRELALITKELERRSRRA